MKPICHEVYKSGRHLVITALGYSPLYNKSCINWLKLLKKQAEREFYALPSKAYIPGTPETENLITLVTWIDKVLPEAISKLEDLRKEWNVS